MVTEIKVGSYRIERSNIGGVRSEAYKISSDHSVLGSVPDEPGEYDVEGGKVSLGFRSDKNGHRFVDLGLRDNHKLGRFLKGGNGCRSVNVSNKGEGHIFLPKGKVLFISTQAAVEQFKVIDKK